MKTIWRTIGGLILSAALLLPAARAATGFGDSPVFAVNLLTNGCSVSGTVLDGNSGNGLVGALVQLGTYNTISGSGGAYSISSVAAGDYTLTGSKSGYSDASSSVTVSPGSSLSRVIVLLPTKLSDNSYEREFKVSRFQLLSGWRAVQRVLHGECGLGGTSAGHGAVHRAAATPTRPRPAVRRYRKRWRWDRILGRADNCRWWRRAAMGHNLRQNWRDYGDAWLLSSVLNSGLGGG